MAQEF